MDGKPDIAIVNQGSAKVGVLRNLSSPGIITATSFATAVTFNTGVTPFKIFSGDLDGDVALPFALGSVGGMIIGSLISSRLPPKYLKLAFALICLLVAAGMVIKAL